MTTIADPVATDPVESVMNVLRSAPGPLTLSLIEKECKAKGTKIPKARLKEMVEEKLSDGKLFQCSPSGKSARYWVHDEYQLINEQIEQALTAKDQSEKDLVKAVTDALKKATAPKVVKEVLTRLRSEKRVHEHPPVKGKTPILSHRPYDPLAGLTLKAATLKELKGHLERAKSAGVTLDRFLLRLGELLSPIEAPVPPATGEVKLVEAPSEPAPVVASRPEATGDEEVRQIILKAVEEAGPSVPVSIAELRRQLPEPYRDGVFNRVVWDLVDKEELFLFRHNQAGLLSESERAELLTDDKGSYYVDLAQRPR